MRIPTRLALVFAFCFVFVPISVSADELIPEEDLDICSAVRPAETGMDNLRRTVERLTIYDELSEVKNVTIDALRAQVRTQGLPFAQFVRNLNSNSTDFNSDKYNSTCFFSLRTHGSTQWHYFHLDRMFPHEVFSNAPDLNRMNNIYNNITSRLSELEASRDVFLRNPDNATSHFPTLQNQCRQSDPEDIFVWIYDQTAGDSYWRHLVRDTLQGRKGVIVNRMYHAWSWTVLKDLDRAACLSQSCSAIQLDEVIPSNNELEREADFKIEIIDEIFDRLIETGTILLKGVSRCEKLGRPESRILGLC